MRVHELMKLPSMAVSRYTQFCFVLVVFHGIYIYIYIGEIGFKKKKKKKERRRS